MTNKLPQWLQNLIGDVRKEIIGVIVLYLLSNLGILWLKNALQMPVPLWLVILISLSILFGCVILFLIYSRKSSKTPSYKIKYFTIDNLKWKTKIFHENYFEVDKISICREHDLPLIHENIYYYCPEFRKKNCKIMIDHNDYSFIYETAKSYIDKEIRNKKC